MTPANACQDYMWPVAMQVQLFSTIRPFCSRPCSRGFHAAAFLKYRSSVTTSRKEADGRSGHGGGEAEGQWIQTLI